MGIVAAQPILVEPSLVNVHFKVGLHDELWELHVAGLARISLNRVCFQRTLFESFFSGFYARFLRIEGLFPHGRIPPRKSAIGALHPQH